MVKKKNASGWAGAAPKAQTANYGICVIYYNAKLPRVMGEAQQCPWQRISGREFQEDVTDRIPQLWIKAKLASPHLKWIRT